MQIEIGQYLLSKNGTTYRSNAQYKLRLASHVIYDVDKLVPVIIPGQGCVCMAKITKLILVDDGTTTVEFISHSCSEETARHYYGAYKSATAISDETVPGVYRSNTGGHFSVEDSDDDEDIPRRNGKLPGWLD